MAEDGDSGVQNARNTQATPTRGQSMNSEVGAHKAPSPWPSQPIPSKIVAYKSHGGWKTVYLHDGEKEEPLFTAGVHTGYSGSGPLGLIPGVILYNGVTKKDRVIATAGYKSLWDSRIYSFSVQSAIKLPPLVPTKDPAAMVTESMRAHTSSKHGVSFDFSVETGDEGSQQRGTFEWIKIKKNTGDVGSGGGFKLMRGEEVVALLSWLKEHLSVFSLEFKGSSLSGELGGRWKLMVVATALRLWYLHLSGGTSKPMVAIGQKIRS